MIDVEHYRNVQEAYEQVFAWEEMEELPYVWTDLPPAEDEDWPDFAYNDTFMDKEKMLLSQLRSPFLHYQTGDYHPLAIRANYGTVILPSIFGIDYQLTETSLPWAHHLPHRDAVRQLIDRGIPDFDSGLGGTCLETAEYFMETLSPYPRLSQQTLIYHPDLQGPFDVAHLIWGPDIFVALYDCPDLVHTLLDLIVRTYTRWLRHWKALVGEGNTFTAHWSIMMRGGAMIRNDTPVMISEKQYKEFVKPYDQRLLDVFGGCIHFCGKGDQFIDSMTESDRLYGIHASQPELNDVEHLWNVTRERRLVLLAVDEEFVPSEARTGVTLQRAWEGKREKVPQYPKEGSKH
jgi:hypothetical protein